MKNDSISSIISLIFNTSRRLHQQAKKENDHPDPFSILRLEVLHYVSEKKNPSMKEVADYFCVTPPSATSLVSPLVKSQALKRVSDKNDRRATRLSVTPKGMKKLKDGLGKIQNRMQKILIKLNKKERENLIKILKKLSNSREITKQT